MKTSSCLRAPTWGSRPVYNLILTSSPSTYILSVHVLKPLLPFPSFPGGSPVAGEVSTKPSAQGIANPTTSQTKPLTQSSIHRSCTPTRLYRVEKPHDFSPYTPDVSLTPQTAKRQTVHRHSSHPSNPIPVEHEAANATSCTYDIGRLGGQSRDCLATTKLLPILPC